MRTHAPPLLPILRSEVQAKLLAALLLHPGREFTLTELAAIADAPMTSVHREINRLTETGLIAERRVGRSLLIAAAPDHPYLKPLTELITRSFGPLTIVAEEFTHLDGALAIGIFGSWAARYSGVDGPTPHDVDVLVIGNANRTKIYDAAERVEQRLHEMPVNPVLCSVKRWHAEADALIQSIKSQPLIWLEGDEITIEAAT